MESGIKFKTAGYSGGAIANSVWDDLRVPVVATKLGGSKDPEFKKVFDNGAGSQGVFTYLFDAGSEEELYFMVQIPHGWKYETDIKPHVHWIPTLDGVLGGVVSWGLEYTLSEIGVTFGNTSFVYGNAHSPSGALVMNKQYITSLTPISMDGIDTLSAMLICRLFRDATGSGLSDTYAWDAGLLEIDFHFEMGSMGSDNELS